MGFAMCEQFHVQEIVYAAEGGRGNVKGIDDRVLR